MAKAHFKASFRGKKYQISIGLSVYLWKDDDIYYAYSPALDITGYGNSESEAKKSFEITLQEFVNYTNNKKTIFDELENLGWTVNRKKKRVHAPELEELLDDNKSFKDIFNREGVKREKRNIELSLV